MEGRYSDVEDGRPGRLNGMEEEEGRRRDEEEGRRREEEDGRRRDSDLGEEGGRFDDMEGRYDGRDRGYGHMNGGYSDMNGGYSDMDERYSDMDGMYSDMDGRYSDMDGRYGDLDRLFSDLEGGRYSDNERFSDTDVEKDEVGLEEEEWGRGDQEGEREGEKTDKPERLVSIRTVLGVGVQRLRHWRESRPSTGGECWSRDSDRKKTFSRGN